MVVNTFKASGTTQAKIKPHVEGEIKIEPVKFRYVCDACTGVAGYSTIPESVHSLSCQACGKAQVVKKENWIKVV